MQVQNWCAYMHMYSTIALAVTNRMTLLGMTKKIQLSFVCEGELSATATP